MTKIKLVIILLKFLLINPPPQLEHLYTHHVCTHTNSHASFLLSLVANKITFTFYLPDQKVLENCQGSRKPLSDTSVCQRHHQRVCDVPIPFFLDNATHSKALT